MTLYLRGQNNNGKRSNCCRTEANSVLKHSLIVRMVTLIKKGKSVFQQVSQISGYTLNLWDFVTKTIHAKFPPKKKQEG